LTTGPRCLHHGLAMRFLAVCLLLCGPLACDDSDIDGAACREVYEALCDRHGDCDDGFAVNQCQTYYREDCRQRRLGSGLTPTEGAVTACAEAISGLDCSGALDPFSLAACDFLEEPAPDGGVDASADESDAEVDQSLPDAGSEDSGGETDGDP